LPRPARRWQASSNPLLFSGASRLTHLRTLRQRCLMGRDGISAAERACRQQTRVAGGSHVPFLFTSADNSTLPGCIHPLSASRTACPTGPNAVWNCTALPAEAAASIFPCECCYKAAIGRSATCCRSCAAGAAASDRRRSISWPGLCVGPIEAARGRAGRSSWWQHT